MISFSLLIRWTMTGLDLKLAKGDLDTVHRRALSFDR